MMNTDKPTETVVLGQDRCRLLIEPIVDYATRYRTEAGRPQ
jgi:hypothetical protein